MLHVPKDLTITTVAVLIRNYDISQSLGTVGIETYLVNVIVYVVEVLVVFSPKRRQIEHNVWKQPRFEGTD